jgi:hypothetical protein
MGIFRRKDKGGRLAGDRRVARGLWGYFKIGARADNALEAIS